MTKEFTGGRFGPVGKTVGSILAIVTGIVGAWGWVYLLVVSVQGRGGLSDLSTPFFTLGLILWIVFWGGALGLIAIFFGKNSRVTLVLLIITGLMLAAAIMTPILAAVL